MCCRKETQELEIIISLIYTDCVVLMLSAKKDCLKSINHVGNKFFPACHGSEHI